jgi:prepilin-type N-terminal cleavage/methylation domain-containing protein
MRNTGKARKGREKGFTIIEVMLVTVVMGVLAALVAPTIRVNTARAKMSEVIHMFGRCRTWITEVYITTESAADLPVEMEWGCESLPGERVSKYVEKVETSFDGIIIATIEGTGDLRLDHHKITLAPLDSNGNLMSTTGRVARWRCGNMAADGTEIPPDLLPSSCNGS